MLNTDRLIDWVKLSPRYLLPIAAVCALLLFGRQPFLEALGMHGFVEHFRSYIGLVFLISVGLVLSSALNASWEWAKDRLLWRNRCKRLQSLTTAEKAVLRGYISKGTRTQYLSIMDGVVTGLAAEDILYRASNASYSATEWAYNIQPWAWEYLSKHPEYVLHPSDPTREQ